MEVVDAIETTPRPHRSTEIARRLVMTGVIVCTDVAAIVAAVGWFGGAHGTSLLLGVFIFCLLVCSGSQRIFINPRLERAVPSLLACIGISFIVLAILTADDPAELKSATEVAAATAVLASVGRGVSYSIIRAARMRAWILEPTLIVGAGKVGSMIASSLRDHREYGLLPVGFLDSFDGVGLSMPILGDARDILRTVQRNRVTKVIVAFGAMGEADMVEVLRACDRLHIEIYVVPRFFELGVTTGGKRYDEVWGIPLMRLRRSAMRAAARRSKRIFDIITATVVLLLTSPVFVAAALAVHLSTPGPIFLRQRRVGKDGREFELLKFRSMVVNEHADTSWLAADNDMTPIGRALRRSSIDELPQLINVLRGDMSLVGPRPERPYFVSQFKADVHRYDDRHRVPAGMTGWAQVHGLKGDTPIPDRVRFDNYYIEHWSLWRDIVIVAQTISKLLMLR